MPERSARKHLTNRPCRGWQVVNSEGTVTVWADEKTAEMVRVEIEEGVVRTVMTDFRFNPNLVESHFSLEVPEGYQVVAKTSFAAKDASEDDLLLLLRAWSGGNGNVFPDSLTDVGGWYKAATKYDWSKEKQDEKTMEKAISRAFFRLGARQDWVYRGKGVKVGNAKQAVFWTPAGNGKYRVIYGDLSVRQADKKELPNASNDFSEDDIVLLLRAWAGGNGNVFPDSLKNVPDWYKAAEKYDWSKEKQDETTLRASISKAFFKLNASQDWVYRGKGVKVGNAKEAVFWTPVAGGKYRVIYGDLSVRQAAKTELPPDQ